MTRALTTGFGPANYLYDGPDVIEELDNSGNVLARYNQIGVDEPLSASETSERVSGCSRA